MKRKTTLPPEPQKPSLLIPRAEAEDKIQKQIKKGGNLSIGSTDLKQAKVKLDQWAQYNKELLSRIFDSDVIAKEYNLALLRGMSIRNSGGVCSWTAGRTRGHNVAVSEGEKFQQEVQVHISKLEGIIQRLELIPEVSKASITEEINKPKTEIGSDIFIVHGRDEAAKESVARFIEKLELNPVILHEKPNKGRTIIEKFEDYSNVGFAIVLMTPDDIGALSGEGDELKPRARQNVIFELGFFIGKIGRNRVCALYSEGVEFPSDYEGVIYIKMKDNWKFELAKEIKEAGIKIDLNKVI